MQNRFLYLFLGFVVIGSIIGINPSESSNANVKIQGNILQPQDSCHAINIGTITNPNYQNTGWCPSTNAFWYFIEDPNVNNNSLISVDVNIPITDRQYYLDNGLTVPECHHGLAGTYDFASGTITGFSVECDIEGNPPQANQTLTYIIANP